MNYYVMEILRSDFVGFIPILFESFEVVIIIGLLVMLLLMFGAVTYDLFKIVRNRKYGRKRKEEK